jgi:23S rRNA pseudouridine1911/1915/1917 synthase
MQTFTVDAEDIGERFDIVVREHIDMSRSQIQKHIKRGQIKLNENAAQASTIIEDGDRVSYPAEILKDDTPEKPEPPTLEVLYEDEHTLVVNKPANLLVHPAPGHEGKATLVDSILAYDASIGDVGEDKKRPGIVHRLDKDASGVLIVAKTQEAFHHYKQAFKKRDVKKEYRALAYGQIEKKHDKIDFKIARSKQQGKMVARPKSQKGKEAETVYDVIERFRTATYVNVRTLTGRTHQIRVHFQAIGHPLVGETLHTIDLNNINPIEIDRIFLHAHKITFKNLDNNEQTVTAPLPDELEEVLDNLPKN